MEAHRVTRAWKEGTGDTVCGADGASWYETQSGENWTTAGGDYDAAVVDSRAVAAGEPSGFHSFTLTSAVQSWVDGSTPNQGLLLRPTDEGTPTNDRYVYYATDDYTISPANRPKLEVSFEDGSVTQTPRVELASPAAGARVSGSSVRLAASAGDDRRVESVEFFVDGASVGRDTTGPFELSWDSAAVGNGQHPVTLTATDDAGNVTTTPTGTTVVVDNTQPPSGAMTAPAAGATVSATVPLAATATDDVGVSQVEFLVDGVRVGAPEMRRGSSAASARSAPTGCCSTTNGTP